jgi:hypothetical protein
VFLHERGKEGHVIMYQYVSTLVRYKRQYISFICLDASACFRIYYFLSKNSNEKSLLKTSKSLVE